MGHKVDQQGKRPLQVKLEAVTEVNTSKNKKELKSFLEAIQHFLKYIENLSANTDTLESF